MEGRWSSDQGLNHTGLMRSMHRALTIIALALGFCAAFINAAGAQSGRVVNVYNWSDYIDPKVLEDFTKDTGIKVQYDTFDANETLETKLLAGKSGYDVVVPTGYFLERQIKASVFQKLDKTRAQEPRQRLAERSEATPTGSRRADRRRAGSGARRCGFGGEPDHVHRQVAERTSISRLWRWCGSAATMALRELCGEDW